MGTRIKLLVSDMILSVMWLCSSVLVNKLVHSVLGFGLYAKVFNYGISIVSMCFFAWLSKLNKGGAYNPIIVLSHELSTVLSPEFSGDFSTLLFTVGARIPAQVIGSIAGVGLILDTFPEIERGPRLKVNMYKGAMTEGFLTFAIVFISLALNEKLPGSFYRKTLITSVSRLILRVLGSDLTGGCMNPALVMGWAYARGDYKTKEHIFVYWLAPIEATVLAVWMFSSILQSQKEAKAKVKAGKSD